MDPSLDANGSATPIRRSALVGQVISTLHRAISSGRWPVGTRLPTESELAGEYGVSRVTLRQAVQALVHVGLLQTIQGSGTFVRATTEVDAVLSRYLAGEELLSVLEVREAIETVAAALAAERRSPDDLAAMTTAIAEEEAAGLRGDADAAAAASTCFHAAVVGASGNPILVHLYAAIRDGAARSIAVSTSPQTPAQFLGEHRALAAAIRDREPERARRIAQQHLRPAIDEARRQQDS